MTDTARLFVAVDLPDAVRLDLATWARRTVGRREDLRLVPADALHLTLAFLGDRPLEEISQVGDAVTQSAGGEVPLRVGTSMWLSPRHPHVLTVAVEDPAGALGALHARVETALAASCGVEPDRRAFRPHVTVARVRRGARVRPVALAAPAPSRFIAPAVTLYRSRLGPGGAQYEPLASASLTRPG